MFQLIETNYYLICVWSTYTQLTYLCRYYVSLASIPIPKILQIKPNTYKLIRHNDVIIITSTELPHKNQSMFKHDLSLPFISPQSIISNTKYHHIWRDGGFRLQHQKINNKQIYHNYGQGLAQYSLAYGCAYIVAKIMTLKSQESKDRQIGVIGSGINALMTTLELLKRGYKVNLYLDQQSISLQKGGRYVGSASGLQFWYSGDYDNQDPLKHELLSKLSFDFYQDSLKANRYRSLSIVDAFITRNKLQQLKQNVTDFITKQIQQISVNFNNSVLQKFICFKTIMIDTELFMQEVFTELKIRNINLIQKTFRTLTDILTLPQTNIFNCLKSENKLLFGDTSIKCIDNYYLTITKPSTSISQNIIIWKYSQQQQQPNFILSITNKKIQLTSRNRNIEKNEIQLQKQRNRIFGSAYQFLKQRTTKPYKL